MFSRVSFICLLVAVSFAQTAKRPLNHKDYDGWRTIAGQHLSADGKFLAYAMFPEEGDGEVVLRNLVTGKDSHFPAGARPQQPAAASTEEGPPPEPRGTTIAFSSDSKFVAFSVFSLKADTDKARKEKKTAEQMPKDSMTIVELSSGKSTTVERVKRFAMPEKAAGYPDAGMFGPLPCTGLYLRHVAGVTVNDFQFSRSKANDQALLVADDVSELDLDGFHAMGATVAGPIFWLNDTRRAIIRNTRAANAPASGLLRTTGACKDVRVEPLSEEKR